jgi:hypothetical protein
VILKETEPRIVFPQTLHLREDMMLTVAGTHEAPNRSTIPGFWCQPYLPVDGELVPRREEHSIAVADRGTRKPIRGFQHPWTFYSAEVFRIADRFSHLGVYQRVNYQVQFYEVDIVASDAPTPDNAVWVFRDDVPPPPGSVVVGGITVPVPPVRPGPDAGRLYIKARKIDWKALAELAPRLLGSLPRDLEALGRELVRRWEQILYKWEEVPASVAEADRHCRASRRSMYNRDGLFVLRDAGPLGWIALWADKRDGDLLALSDLPMEVELFGESDPRRRIRVRFKRNHRVYQPPVVLNAAVRMIRSVTGDVLQLAYQTDLSRHE